MRCQFKETSSQPERFFNILPEDWQVSIVPFWPAYQQNSRIFTLETDTAVLGGGIVFGSVSPDTKIYSKEAQNWFKRGYLYIGFLWIDENFRGKNLGSMWLKALDRHFPDQKFWLAIEEERLAAFYEKNGFRFAKKIETQAGNEWIWVKDSRTSSEYEKS